MRQALSRPPLLGPSVLPPLLLWVVHDLDSNCILVKNGIVYVEELGKHLVVSGVLVFCT